MKGDKAVDKLIELLKKNGVEVTDDLKSSIANIWEKSMPDTADLFTQKEVNEIVKKRLGREQKMHDNEIETFKKTIKDMVDPEKVEEYKDKITSLEKESQKKSQDLIKDYELQLAAAGEGIADREYFEFLVRKNGLRDRLKVDEKGKVFCLDDSREFIKVDGELVGPSYLVKELKKEKPEIFKSIEDKGDIGGSSNPGANEVDRIKTTKDFARSLGYARQEIKE